jgi:hypothetical protein
MMIHNFYGEKLEVRFEIMLKQDGPKLNCPTILQ